MANKVTEDRLHEILDNRESANSSMVENEIKWRVANVIDEQARLETRGAIKASVVWAILAALVAVAVLV